MSERFIDVSTLFDGSSDVLEIEDDVPLEQLACGDTLLVFERPPHVRAVVSNVSGSALLTGSVACIARVECARCLEPFDLELEASLSGMLVSGCVSDEAADAELIPLVHGGFDLIPVVEAAIRVEAPFAPIHDEACEGICPTCGCNLNEMSCDCADAHGGDGADNPFACLAEPRAEREGQ